MSIKKYRVALSGEFTSEEQLSKFIGIFQHHVLVDMFRATDINCVGLDQFEVEELDYPDVKIEDLV